MASSYRLTCLFVDLKTATSRRVVLGEDVSMARLGGRGIGVHFLAAAPTIAPLHEDNPLVFATGPLVGSRIPSSGRMVVSSFSPLTNTVCTSVTGGDFAYGMRKAGLDVIHLSGKAPVRSVVFIEDDRVSMEKDPFPDDVGLELVFERLSSPGRSTAAIGEAAIKGCLYSSIMVDGCFASGRGGLGLVMASKNVRAVSIRGNGPSRRIPVDEHEEDRARSDIVRLFDASPFVRGRSGIAASGTAALIDLVAERRMMPTANFRRTYFEGYRAFSANAFARTFSPRRHACRGCPIACKGKAAGPIPEYETIAHFGALNENDDIASIVEANRLCNSLGMDTISAASTIACLAEIRGVRFQGEGLVSMVRRIVHAGTSGELLRQGSLRMARALGAPETSMSVKGLELPAYDPRGAYGMAIAYATSTRGGCHLRAYPIASEILRKPVATDRFTFSGKARMVKIAEDLCTAVDTIGACRFALIAASLEEYARGVSAVTGIPLGQHDLMRMGEEVYSLEISINAARGFTSEDDTLPERFFREAGTPGPGFETPAIDKVSFEQALERYRRIRASCGAAALSTAESPCTTR